MSIKSDFIVRQMQEFFSVLIGWILGVGKEKFAHRLEVSFQTYKLLEFDPEQLRLLTVEDVFSHFENDPNGLQKVELLSYSVLNQYLATDPQETVAHLLPLAHSLFNELELRSPVYSMERKMTLELLDAQLSASAACSQCP